MCIAGDVISGDAGAFPATDPAVGEEAAARAQLETGLPLPRLPRLPAAVRESNPEGLLRLVDGTYTRN